MRKLALAIAFVAMLTVSATGVWASAIQVTLSSSSAGGLAFTNNSGTLGFSFTGTVAQCGHANCMSGNALLEPQTMLGKYWMWMTGSPTLMGGPSDYAVNMNGGSINLAVSLTGFPDTLTTTLDLTDLFGGTSKTPLFDGTFSSTASTGTFLAADFPSGVNGSVDFTIRLNRSSVSTLGSNQSVSGNVSSGELFPTPEPASLALLGTGVLGLAGMVRRKTK
jgi:PEP-CTERM motif